MNYEQNERETYQNTDEWECPKCKRKVSPYSLHNQRCIICEHELITGKKAIIVEQNLENNNK